MTIHMRDLFFRLAAAGSLLLGAISVAAIPIAHAQQQQRPNILVTFGDDIGIPQISAYTMGMMGYRTPNIDRIPREGVIFTDSYGQQALAASAAS